MQPAGDFQPGPGGPGQYPPGYYQGVPQAPPRSVHPGRVGGPPRPARGGVRTRNVILGIVGGLLLFVVGIAIGAAAKSPGAARPGPTVTVTAPGGNPAPAVTVTVTPGSAGGAAPATGAVLFKFSGSGIRNSAPFKVTGSAVKARYTYDCAAFGGQGNFIADLVSGTPGSFSYDDQSIADALGRHGSQTTTVYPADQGSDYHLEVNSECSWSITLTRA